MPEAKKNLVARFLNQAEMRPCFAGDDAPDSMNGYVKFAGYKNLRLSFICHLNYFRYLRFLQLGRMLTLTANASPFLLAVFSVDFCVTRKQVIRAHARRIVALMADLLRQIAMFQLKREPVRQHRLFTASVKTAIAKEVTCASLPLPAFAVWPLPWGFVDHCPEAINRIIAQILTLVAAIKPAPLSRRPVVKVERLIAYLALALCSWNAKAFPATEASFTLSFSGRDYVELFLASFADAFGAARTYGRLQIRHIGTNPFDVLRGLQRCKQCGPRPIIPQANQRNSQYLQASARFLERGRA